MRLLPLLLLVISFSSLASATMFDIGSDENNLSTFTFNWLIEKIEIYGNDAVITNQFNFLINSNETNQTIYFYLDIPYNDGRNLSLSSYEYSVCGSQIAHENSENLVEEEEVDWGLDCGDKPGKKNMDRYGRKNYQNIREGIDLNNISWGDHEVLQERRGVYAQVKYVLEGYVIENKGQYEYIPIDKFQTSKSYVSFENGNNIIILTVPEQSVIQGMENFRLKTIDENKRLVFEYRKPREDSLITFIDADRQYRNNFLENVSLIIITLGISFLMIPLSLVYKKKGEIWRAIFYISSFVLIASGIVGIQGKVEGFLWWFLAAFLLFVLLNLWHVLSILIRGIKEKGEKNGKKKG